MQIERYEGESLRQADYLFHGKVTDGPAIFAATWWTPLRFQ
ncbi:MAG: hypothetical protein ACLQNE_20355 [Thermoguttaceae bacterium]